MKINNNEKYTHFMLQRSLVITDKLGNVSTAINSLSPSRKLFLSRRILGQSVTNVTNYTSGSLFYGGLAFSGNAPRFAFYLVTQSSQCHMFVKYSIGARYAFVTFLRDRKFVVQS